MRYEVDARVFEFSPGFYRAVVVAEHLDNSTESPAVEHLLRQCEARARQDDWATFRSLPALAVWDEVFKKMGLNPKRYPPSVINLVKRVRGGKPLPYVNTLVALFNCISLKYLLPCGGDDLGVVEGDLRLGVATGNESYVPLGQSGVCETPPEGEIIYYDTATLDVFCRAWCWKNGDRSKLTPQTRRAVINLDAMAPVEPAIAQAAAQELAGLLQTHTGAITSIHTLTRENPWFEVEK